MSTAANKEISTPFRPPGTPDPSPLTTPVAVPPTVGETLLKGSLLIQRITGSQQIVWQKRTVELTKDVLMISKNEKLAAIISLKQIGSVKLIGNIRDELGDGVTFQVLSTFLTSSLDKSYHISLKCIHLFRCLLKAKRTYCEVSQREMPSSG